MTKIIGKALYSRQKPIPGDKVTDFALEFHIIPPAAKILPFTNQIGWSP